MANPAIAPAGNLDESVRAAVLPGVAAPEARIDVCDCDAPLVWGGGVAAASVEVSVTLLVFENECVLCVWKEGLDSD